MQVMLVMLVLADRVDVNPVAEQPSSCTQESRFVERGRRRKEHMSLPCKEYCTLFSFWKAVILDADQARATVQFGNLSSARDKHQIGRSIN